MLFKKYKKAFTLVELIIGIAVMGTIASFSTASYVGYKDMADKEQGKLDIQQVKNAVDNFYSSNQKYPTKPISKQPTPDVKDSTGKVTFEGYSEVNVDLLVEQRYLQAVPKLKNGQFFAVNFNGVVSIKDGFSESVIVDGGNSLVDTKVGDMVPFEVFTGEGCSSITIFETGSNYATSGSGVNFKTKAPSREDNYELYTGQVKVSNSQGQKYFVIKIRYNDGKSVELRTTFQYALSADKVSGDVYWINTNPNVDQSTDEGKATNEILSGAGKVDKVGTGIKLNWTSKELATGASAIKYEIEKFVLNPKSTSNNDKWIPAPDSPIVTGNTEYVDNAVNSSSTYKYNIYAYTASKNQDGSNKKTLNSLEAANIKPNTYKDTQSYIENITRNDFNTAYNKNVSVRVGDVDDGIMQVTLRVAKVEKGKVGAFKSYKMNKTPDGTSTITAGGQKVTTDVYTVPIEVEDDYMIYYIEAIDGRGVATYCYMNPALTKGDKETDTAFEQRRQVVSANLPSNLNESCYTLMRGLVEIFNDSYIDDSKIDVPKSNFHLYDGKVILP